MTAFNKAPWFDPPPANTASGKAGNGAVANRITEPTVVEEDTTYTVASYLSIESDFTVSGNVLIIG
jgi:hypothetical protein